MSYPKRLTEVDLPIRRISTHALRESIQRRHISALRIWWARRSLAARGEGCLHGTVAGPSAAGGCSPHRFRCINVHTGLPERAVLKNFPIARVPQLMQVNCQRAWEREVSIISRHSKINSDRITNRVNQFRWERAAHGIGGWLP